MTVVVSPARLSPNPAPYVEVVVVLDAPEPPPARKAMGIAIPPREPAFARW